MQKIRLVVLAGLCALLLVVSSINLQAAPSGDPAAPDACSELLTNGNFESGNVDWMQEGRADLISQFNPRTGQWGAWLAGSDNADNRITQQIVVPANGVVTLRFWWERWTREPAPNTGDYLAVNVLNSSGAKIQELTRLGVDPDQPPWEQLTFGMTGYSGKTVQLQFQAKTDVVYTSDFFVDDVSVTTCTAKRLYLPLNRR